jgi:hypothetical protein
MRLLESARNITHDIVMNREERRHALELMRCSGAREYLIQRVIDLRENGDTTAYVSEPGWQPLNDDTLFEFWKTTTHVDVVMRWGFHPDGGDAQFNWRGRSVTVTTYPEGVLTVIPSGYGKPLELLELPKDVSIASLSVREKIDLAQRIAQETLSFPPQFIVNRPVGVQSQAEDRSVIYPNK